VVITVTGVISHVVVVVVVVMSITVSDCRWTSTLFRLCVVPACYYGVRVQNKYLHTVLQKERKKERKAVFHFKERPNLFKAPSILKLNLFILVYSTTCTDAP